MDVPSAAGPAEVGAEAAQKALRERPSISIRVRIVLAFLSLFILSAAVSTASLLIVSRIKRTLLFLEACASYAFEIQQARRYEKNYFLYGTNLDDAKTNIRDARHVLEHESGNIRAVVGDEGFSTMMRHASRYNELLGQLPAAQRGAPPTGQQAIELELRQHGAEMVAVAAKLLNRERQRVDTMLYVSKQITLGFIVLLLALILYTTHFLAKQMLQPLNRFVNYTQRIAHGDFSPITPAKRYRDEFSDLAMAINLMLDRLKKHEEQLLQSRKMAAIGNLTSGIAHEINNPLNNISLTVETLMEDADGMPPEERKKLLNDIFAQTERASGTVRNLLDFTRMERPTSASLDVCEIISATLRLVKNEIELKRIELKRERTAGLPKVRGDFSQLQQVFLNLILNAVQAMPAGGTLTMRAQRDDDMLRVEVSDTGHGIPETDLPYIFDPFFTTKEQGQGTGLGLSVSFGIIRKHGGRIAVESRLNRGTTFAVYLPLEQSKSA